MYQKHFRGGSHSGAAKQFNYRKPGGRGGHGGGRGRGGRGPGGGFSKYIDVSKFVNKAVITEKTEHFVPDHNFADFQIDNRLKTNIATKGYFVPTPIQEQALVQKLKEDLA
jgi:hypothetical protein